MSACSRKVDALSALAADPGWITGMEHKAPGLDGMRCAGTEIKLVVPGSIIFRKMMPVRRSLFAKIKTLFR